MKKLLLLFVALLGIGYVFQSCDDGKTYAEQLEDEQNAIEEYIKRHNIKVINFNDFVEKDSTTDTLANEYVLLTDGIYMQIRDKGSKDKSKIFDNGNEITARYEEYSLMDNDANYYEALQLTNVYSSINQNPSYYSYPDVFRYIKDGNSVYGIFLSGLMQLPQSTSSGTIGGYGTTTVPSGWLVALPYLRDSASVNLIIPSKMGHSYANEYVMPYVYKIQRFAKSKR